MPPSSPGYLHGRSGADIARPGCKHARRAGRHQLPVHGARPGRLLGSVLGGQLYDRLRGHRVMALMIVLMAVSTALTPSCPLLWLLVAVLFVTGAVQGVLQHRRENALLVWVHGNKVGPFMNGLHFFFGVGTFITPIIVAQFIARQGGLVGNYMLLAVIILPTAVLPSCPARLRPKPPRA